MKSRRGGGEHGDGDDEREGGRGTWKVFGGRRQERREKDPGIKERHE